MAEHELDRRLLAVALTLDTDAPAFDPSVLRAVDGRRARRRIAALAAAAALACAAAAPAAVSALGDLFGVDSVPELGPVGRGVAPPYPGRLVPPDDARATVSFRVRTIGSLGPPDAYVRDDIVGGMVTLAYDGGRIRLTQWATTDVSARAAVAQVSGTAEDVTIGHLRGLWLAGAARGTFTLVGADGTVHREVFEVAAGALLWQDGAAAFLLQGADTKDEALGLAAATRPAR